MRECVDFISAPAYTPLEQSLDAIQGALAEWLRARNLQESALIWARLFLSDAANQTDLVKSHPLYRNTLSHSAFSYIGQPMLNGAKAGLMFAADLSQSIRKEGTPDKMTISSGDTTMLFHSIRLTDEEAKSLTPRQQTEEIFNRHINWLQERGLTLKDNCIRTWLYVRDIDNNYHQVMQGRNAIFDREGLTPQTHFIASTGIGGNTQHTKAIIGIDFLSVEQPHHAPQYLQALEYLNPTHQYGVAFERGVKFNAFGNDKIYISGTASIDKNGNCIYLNDTPRQIERLFENISQLLADAQRTLADITYLIVYLRDIADYQLTAKYMAEHFPTLPYVITEARVCRPQWLVEVECVAR